MESVRLNLVAARILLLFYYRIAETVFSIFLFNFIWMVTTFIFQKYYVLTKKNFDLNTAVLISKIFLVYTISASIKLIFSE